MAAGVPARSARQLDLMRRLKVRDAQHGDLARPFLEDEERERLSRILDTSVEDGITDKVERQAHDFLVRLGERDAMVRFLTDDERNELAALTKFDAPSPKPGNKKKPKPESGKRSMTGGEFVVSVSVLLSIVGTGYAALQNPVIRDSAFWMVVWGVVCGSSFIGDTRRRSKTDDGSATMLEGLVAAIIWVCAAVGIVIASSHHVLSGGWAALLGFAAAGMLGRKVLSIEQSNDRNGN